jgi:hypothetical protein
MLSRINSLKSPMETMDEVNFQELFLKLPSFMNASSKTWQNKR